MNTNRSTFGNSHYGEDRKKGDRLARCIRLNMPLNNMFTLHSCSFLIVITLPSNGYVVDVLLRDSPG